MGLSITRRRCLEATGGAGVVSALAGCANEESGTDDENNSQDTDTTEDSSSETSTREVLYDMTVEDRLQEEHEFSSGDVLYVEASINYDGRGVFTLNVGPGEELRKTDIEDARSFSQEIEHDGTHIVNAVAGGGPEGQMELRIEIERIEK